MRRAVGRLILDSWIPQGIAMDDGVGGGQIDTATAGLEADQEERHLASLKVRDRAARSVFCGAREPVCGRS
jgi:hypothetical protein